MSWLDGISGLFSNEQNTTNKSSQTGTTQNNLWNSPGLQDFLSRYQQQYGNAGNFNVPTNPYQTGAADQQSGVAGGLNAAMGTANTIGATGLNPASFAQYQDPYTQQVVDATQRDFDVQNQRSLQNVTSNAAMKGALGNSNTEVAKALALESNRRQQNPIIANLRSQGFNTAAGLAGQSAGLQLQGANTAGSLSNAATGANTALSGMGQNIWNSAYQNAMAPYSLMNQGIQGYLGLGNLAGSTTSGTSTGTSNTTQTPSMGSIFAGLAGTALSAYSDERVKENIKPIGETYDGQPIYKYNLKGSPKTQIGLMAQDVEVRDPESVGSLGGIKTVDYDRATRGAERFSSGGMVPTNETSSPNSLHDKVGAAYRMLQGLSKASGGSVKGYDAGGWVTSTTPHNGGPDSNSSYWDGIKDQAIANPTGAQGSPLGKLGSGLSSMGKDMGSMDGLGDGGLGAQQAALSQMLTGLGKGFADGGAPSGGLGYMPAEWSDNAPVFEDEPEAPSFAGAAPREPNKGSSFFSGLADTLSNIPKPFSGGVWAGEQATPMQRFGAALTQIGNGPFAGVGQHIIAQQKNRLEEQQAERMAQQLMRQASQFRTQHELDQQRFQESKRHNLATEDRAASQFERQMKFDEARIGKLEVPEVTRQAEAVGLPRGTPEHNEFVRKLLTKGDKTETEFDKGIGKASAGDYEKRQDAIRDGQNKIQRLDQMESLINNPSVYQGPAGDYILGMKKTAQALGFNMDGISDAEALRAISNQMALSLRSTAGGEGMPGAMSDADRQFLLQSTVGLGNSREGNALLARMMKEAEAYKTRANTEAQNYIQTNKSNVGLGQYMAGWMKANPVVSDRTRADAAKILEATPTAPELPTLTPQQARQHPPGTRFRGTDGNVYVVPGLTPEAAPITGVP